MTPAKTALLSDRGVVHVHGEDAEKLLQGVITNDMDLLAKQPAIHAALLTPQGKILFEFFVMKGEGGFLLETAKDHAPGLTKRLTLYKLRAKADIRDVSADHSVLGVWGDVQPGSGEAAEPISFSDPRLPELGVRVVANAKFAADVAATTHGLEAPADAYHAHRIALGVPEGGKDYAFGDAFPHEANFDLLKGVSFSKGCFVGQEVVSRMQHRGTARKRIVIVEGSRPLQTGIEITAGTATIGTIGSVSGNHGLALLRLDRADEAQRKGDPLTAAGATITVRRPGYLNPAIAADAS